MSGVGLRVCVALACAVPLAAQPMRAERQAHAQLMELRAELLDGWLAAKPEARKACVDFLASADDADPFACMASALALLRGETPSVFDRVRAGTVILALPEVVDDDHFHELHVTIQALRLLPADLPEIVFDVTLLDATGKQIASATIDKGTTPDELMRYRATAPLPLNGAADGRYRAVVGLRLGGEASRPLGEVPVIVDRRFPKRAELLPMLIDGTAPRVEHARSVYAGLAKASDLDRSVLQACTLRVERPYSGEPRLPLADPLHDLACAEAVLKSLQEGVHALTALHGTNLIALPLTAAPGDGAGFSDRIFATVDPDQLAPRDGDDRRPLVVVVPGAPIWTRAGHRPDSPQTLDPAWATAALRRVGFDDGTHVLVVLESPGRFRSPTGAVLDALDRLRELAPGREVVLIGEREGAFAASRVALDPRSSVQRLVVVDGGPVTRRELEQREDLHVAVVLSHGLPANGSLLLVAQAASATGRVRVLEVGAIPWCIALPAAAPAILRCLDE